MTYNNAAVNENLEAVIGIKIAPSRSSYYRFARGSAGYRRPPQLNASRILMGSLRQIANVLLRNRKSLWVKRYSAHSYWSDEVLADGAQVMGNRPAQAEASRWITSLGIIAIGADQECVECEPSEHEDNWLPGHCHFLAEAGCVMMELLDLESLARDKVYELCFIGAPIRFRGATGAPLRPIAMPLRR
ncbi:MAG: hypothetical protein KF853_04105 [Rhodocyclaceae bacterium]|nr:hypothetical protein [Rhodocyclaceae bacterium]